MATFSNWIKQTFDGLFDFGKDERIEELASEIQQGLREKRKEFSFSEAIESLDHKESDLPVIKDRVFRRILSQGWKDGQLVSEERNAAKWVAQCLEISNDRAAEINLELAQHHFAASLAQSMEDSLLGKEEIARLSQIARSSGNSAAQFIQHFFRDEGERFLYSMFSACVSDGRLSQDEWNNLGQATSALGFSRQEFIETIQSPARHFVEHVLADAKSEGKISEGEESILDWFVENLLLDSRFKQYAKGEVNLLRRLSEIDRCKLPVLAIPAGLQIKSGELLHFSGSAVWAYTRRLKSGPKHDSHQGMLHLTDNRLVFVSSTKSMSAGHSRVVSHTGRSAEIQVQLRGKPTYIYTLEDVSPIPYAIFSTLVAMENQTKTAPVTGKPSRYIPRDVRRRTWHRCGGRCVTCGATHELEYDHIIPHAKGGSNADANVQLLCRPCNQSKSDNI